MRRVVAALGVAGLALALAQPAGAQAPPVAISIFEGGGQVCTTAASPQWENLWKNNSQATPAPRPNKIASKSCTYWNDALWSRPLDIANDSQGLYAPSLGPPAFKGGFTFNAGPDLDPPTTYCVSSANPGGDCSILSAGELHPSSVSGTGQPNFGVYAGSSFGRGFSITTAGANTTRANFGWDQSWATILPIVGDTTTGGKIAGFTSSRGGAGAQGSAGVGGEDDPTTIFRVEGMFVFVNP